MTLNNDQWLSRDFFDVASMTQTNRLISIELEIIKYQLMSKCESIAQSLKTPTTESANLKCFFFFISFFIFTEDTFFFFELHEYSIIYSFYILWMYIP